MPEQTIKGQMLSLEKPSRESIDVPSSWKRVQKFDITKTAPERPESFGWSPVGQAGTAIV